MAKQIKKQIAGKKSSRVKIEKLQKPQKALIAAEQQQVQGGSARQLTTGNEGHEEAAGQQQMQEGDSVSLGNYFNPSGFDDGHEYKW